MYSLASINYRPLPDERPRQSVANLIGRFENQTKRQPSSSYTQPPRSSSVISHNTGDSLKDDLKRDSPPKFNIRDKLESPTIVPRSLIPPPQSVPRPVTPPMAIEPPLPLANLPPATSVQDADVDIEPPATEEPIDPEPPVPAPKPIPGTPSRTVQATTKPAVPKSTPSTPSKSAIRTVAKSPASKQTLNASTMQPLKPQHTGHSATSMTSVKRAISKPLASTPVRAKTPARGISGVTVPPSTRPKTPSSGLFAPTAASLAKSRSAQGTSVSSVKKPALTSSVSDRLNKPTAASLSKARSPAPTVAQPVRTPAKTTTSMREGTTKGTPKPKASVPAKHEPSAKKPEVLDSAAVSAAVGPIIEKAHEQQLSDPDVSIGVESADNHLEVTSVTPEESGSAIEETTVEDTNRIEEILPAAPVVVDESITNIQDEPLDVVPSPEVSEKYDVAAMETQTSDTDETINGHQELPVLEKSEGNQGAELESMVNFLEAVSVPKVRPHSIASIPDEVHEIPDEE